MAETFQEMFIEAMEEIGVDKEDAIEKLMAEYYEQKKIKSTSYTDKDTPYYEYLYSETKAGTISEKVVDADKVKAYLTAAQNVYSKTDGFKVSGKDESALNELMIIIMNFVVTSNGYTLKDLDSNKNFDTATGEIIAEVKDNLLKEFPVVADGPIYVFDKNVFAHNQVSKLREYAAHIKQYCPDYTFEMMYEDEKECGFEYDAAQKPVFRCALEYTFNSDGSLSVSLPANSIVFDETAYNLTSITPLQYFGCGDMTGDGYIFYPDGSGSILDYSDFYNDEKKVAVNLESKVYGQDYCYSNITGKHREQITMPVYGIVTTAKANEKTENSFVCHGEYGDYEGKALILATGAHHKKLGIDGEEKLTGRGVSYCAVCDGAFFKEKTTCVIGGGSTALADALLLSELCEKVYLIHRRDEFRGEAHVVERLREKENVEFVLSSSPTAFIGEDSLTAVRVKDLVSEDEKLITCNGAFVAVGQAPDMDIFKNLIELNNGGYAKSGESCVTVTPGVFVAGDCREKSIRQLTTAVSDGTVAALAACDYVDSL